MHRGFFLSALHSFNEYWNPVAQIITGGYSAYTGRDFYTGGSRSKLGSGAKVGIGVLTLATLGASTAETAIADESVTVFRVFGGDARAQGFSWTPIDPTTISDFRNVAGLPSGGMSGVTNTADFMIVGRVNPQNIISSYPAASLDGNIGGIMEYIINPEHVTIIDFKILHP